MEFRYSPSVRAKLQARSISQDEVCECFFNREHHFLTDPREEHRTNPPTLWFIAETDKGRRLKICFVKVRAVNNSVAYEVKTVYEPSTATEQNFSRFAKRL